MLLYARGSEQEDITDTELGEGLQAALKKLGPRKNVLIIPPDFTRFHSRAGMLTEAVWNYYGDRVKDILPALGSHAAMTREEIRRMFGSVPPGLFRHHHWRSALTTLGRVPSDFIHTVSEGKLDFSWPVQVNPLVASGAHDLILSIGQVVPHEVAGMANHIKNLFVGTGGKEGIDKSHFLGAVYGMERIMGRADNPVRAVFDYGSRHFAGGIPVVFVLTVVGKSSGGRLKTRGLYIGDDIECFHRAAELSKTVNITVLERSLKKVVVFLDAGEYRSTWLGNKSIYRTRMAVATGGELIVLAPGVKEFGEDREIDCIIRKYGYTGAEHILAETARNEELKENLSAAAHLIHGSVEGRFTVTYCPGCLTREEIEGAGFRYGDLESMINRYNPEYLQDGYNTGPDGEEVFFISNPATGLWSVSPPPQ